MNVSCEKDFTLKLRCNGKNITFGTNTTATRNSDLNVCQYHIMTDVVGDLEATMCLGTDGEKFCSKWQGFDSECYMGAGR